MAIVLTGGAVLTVNAANEFLPSADIRIQGDAIAALGPAGSLAQPGDTLIDCSEALITPGLINVHTHAATAFYRGMAEDQPREFWSAGYAMPGQASFTVEDHVLSVRAACAEFLLNGVTCIADRLGNMDSIAPGIEIELGRSSYLYSDPINTRVVGRGSLRVADAAAASAIYGRYQNEGTISVSAGKLLLSGDWTNQGTIDVSGAGYLSLGGTFKSRTEELAFNDLRVTEDHLLGERGKGYAQFLHTLDDGRIALAASGTTVDAPLVPLQEVLMDSALQRDTGAELFVVFPRKTFVPESSSTPPTFCSPNVFPLTTHRDSRTVAPDAAGSVIPVPLFPIWLFSSVTDAPESAEMPVLFPDIVELRTEVGGVGATERRSYGTTDGGGVGATERRNYGTVTL